MGKTKKNIRAEKNKTKLKGAHLPKGLNVTKTDFKIKKIVIREQLKQNVSSDLMSSKNLNIKECLTRLNHHNIPFRTEALRNLKEIVTKFLDVIVTKHLGDIIQSIAKLSLDIDHDVRRESFKVLGIILGGALIDHIRPFFEILSSYIRCAMTHIQPSVQEDSLFMLDVLITYVPSLLSANSDKIFRSFLDMMSKLRIESKPERTLTLNLSSKQTSIKWRTKVLERLNSILQAIINEKKDRKKVTVEQIKNIAENLIEDAFELDHHNESYSMIETNNNLNLFTKNNPMYFPIIRSHLNRNCLLPSLFNRSLDKMSTTLLKGVDDGTKIKHYILTLMPLLLESWLEVKPKSEEYSCSSSFELTMSTEAALTLKFILNIMQQLCDLINIWENEVNNQELTEWFRNTYSEDFAQHFVAGFPMKQSEPRKGNKNSNENATTKDFNTSGGYHCLAQNLSICFLYGHLNPIITKQNSDNGKKILKYLTDCLEWRFNSSDTASYYVKVLHLLLLENGIGWTARSSGIGTSELLKNIINITMQKQSRMTKDSQVKLLVFLCEIILNEKLYRSYGKQVFTKWIPTLPAMLCQSHISGHALKTFSCLARQNNEIFLKSFNENSEEILNNLSRIHINGVNTQFEGKQLIANLFYWTNKNQEKDIQLLLKKIQEIQPKINDEIILYFKQILSV